MSEHKAVAPTPAQISEVAKHEEGGPTKGSASAQMQSAYGKELNAERMDAQIQHKKNVGVQITDEDQRAAQSLHDRANAASAKAEMAARQILDKDGAHDTPTTSGLTPINEKSPTNAPSADASQSKTITVTITTNPSVTHDEAAPAISGHV